MKNNKVSVYEFGTCKVSRSMLVGHIKTLIKKRGNRDDHTSVTLIVREQSWSVVFDYDSDFGEVLTWGTTTFVPGDDPEHVADELLEDSVAVWDELRVP